MAKKRVSEVSGDDGQKGKPKKSNATETANEKEKSAAIGSNRVLRRRSAASGEGSVDEKAKGTKPMEVDEKAKGKKPMEVDDKLKGKRPLAKKGSLTIDADAGKRENAGKKKVVAEEENKEKAETPVKRRRNTSKNEKETGDLSGSSRVLRPRTPRKGDEIVNDNTKGKKPVGKKSGKIDAEVGKVHSAAKRKTMAEAERASYALQSRMLKQLEDEKRALEDVKAMPSKGGRKKGAQTQKRENAEAEKAGGSVSRKTVSNRRQSNTETRKNPVRKGRANTETKK